MAFSKAFAAYIQELFGGLGLVRVKGMFGGAGVYADELMFAFIADDSLFLRVDAEIEDRFKAEGSQPYIFHMRDGREVAISYWSAPEAALEAPEEAETWARLSLGAALRKQALKARKR